MEIANVKMCHSFCYVLIFSFVFMQCNTLTCRSEGGPKEEDLKTIYRTCLQKQEGKNFTESRGFQDGQDWKDPSGRFLQRTQTNRDLRDRHDGMDDRDGRMGSRGDRFGGRDDRINGRKRIGNRGDGRDSGNRMDSRDDNRMNGRDSMMDGTSRTDRNNYHMIGNRDGFGDEHFYDRLNYPQEDDFESDTSQYPGYHSTNKPTRRFKRSKRTQRSSGQRSQYNRNNKRPSEDEETYSGNDNSDMTNFSKILDTKACALHCFMEQLEMIDDNGMPDRYLVTHAITKDVKNEDLRDFLQESIEECFHSENTEDKCVFSKNLMMCLSDKGRDNCDDWKEDLKF